MAWETPGRKQQHVDTLVITRANEARGDAFCRSNNTPQPPRIYRQIEFGRAGSPLHLDEGDRATTPCNKVDFSPGGFHTLRENTPTFEPEIPRRQRLTPPAESFPLSAIHFNSIARA